MSGALLRGTGWLMLALVIALVLALAMLRFAPEALWPLLQGSAEDAGYHLEQSGLAVTLMPVSVSVDRLTVSTPGAESAFAQAGPVVAGIDLAAAVAGRAWLRLQLEDVELRPYLLPANSSDDTAEPAASINLSPLDAVSALSLSGFRLYAAPDSAANAELASSLTRSDAHLDLELRGRVAGIDLDVAGELEQAATPALRLTASTLDLTPLLQSDEAVSDEAGGFDASILDGSFIDASVVAAGESALSVELDMKLPALQLTLSIAELLGVRERLPLADADLFPAALSADLAGGSNRLTIENLDARWGPNDVRGDVTLNAQPLGLTAGLKSERLVLPAPRQSAAQADEDEADEELAPLFPDTQLELAWLRDGVIDVRLQAVELAVLDAEFSALSVTAAGRDGDLNAAVTGTFGEGGFEAEAGLRALADTLELSTSAALSGVQLEAFGFVPQDELSGGELVSRINLTAAGASPNALASSASGKVLLTVTDAVVQNDTFELIGSDLLMETLSKLNPFVRSDPTTRLDCALVAFDVADGVLTSRNDLVVETEKMEIVGNGTITLPTEAIDIGFSPSARAGIGVNVGSLVKFLKVGGTLRQPKPTADAVGLLKSGAAVGAAVSTGGVSVLAEGLLKRVANAGLACERALASEASTPAG